MTDPLARLRVSNQLLEDALKGTSGLLEMCESRMQLALDGDTDPTEALERCLVDLRTERTHIAHQIERIRSWREGEG